MNEGGSLSNIVREHFRYIARDGSKSSQEKVLGIMGAAVRFTHQATQTGDQETLQYLLNETYVKDFVLAIPMTTLDARTLPDSDRTAILKLPALGERIGQDKSVLPKIKVVLPETQDDIGTTSTGSLTDQDIAAVSATVDISFLTKYDINKDEEYRLSDAVALLFPGGRDGKLGKQYYMNAYWFVNSIVGNFKDLLIEVPKTKRTHRYIKGSNIPLLWQRLLSRQVVWKEYLPKELISDVQKYGAGESLEARIDTTGTTDLQNYCSTKFKPSQDYAITTVLKELFPGLSKNEFHNIYWHVIKRGCYTNLVISRILNGRERQSYFVKEKNIIRLIELLMDRKPELKDKLCDGNLTCNQTKLLRPSENVVLEEIRQLSPIIKHEVLAEVYGIQRSRVAVISTERDKESRFIDRVAHSGDRLEYALDLYKNNNIQRVRDIVREHVFSHTASDLAIFASEKLEDYVTSWIGLYLEVFGHDSSINVIKEKVRSLSSKKVLEIILDLTNLEDLPQDVLEETSTLTSWLDHNLRVYTSSLVPEGLTNCFEEAINGLDEQEQEILRMRYGERLNMIKNGYKRPSFKDVSEALGIHEVVACTKESSAIEKLRQPELAPKIINFLGHLVQHFNNQVLEPELVK